MDELKMKQRRKKVSGTLNSKNPNPYEIAYKELWDKLPKWKKISFSENIASGEYNWSLYEEFVKQVSERAEELYSANK